MKWEEYIPKLNSLEQDFEEGLLMELREEPPTNLHNEIIKSITKEKHKFNILNYKFYVPAMAALLIFAVMVNRPEVLNNLKFLNSVNVTDKSHTKNSGEGIIAGNSGSELAKSGTSHNGTTIASADVPKTIVAPDTSTTKDNTPSTTQKNNSLASAQTPPKDNTQQPDVTTEGENLSELNIDNIIAMNVFKEPAVDYEIILGNPNTSALSFITENYDEKLINLNTYELSVDQHKNLTKLLGDSDIINKVTSTTEDSATRVVRLYFVNYSILISDSQPSIINYIQNENKVLKLGTDIYKISKTNMKEFDKILQEASIQKNIVYEEENGFIIFKMRITNYETTIGSNHEAILSFLRDRTRCSLVDNSIYKMNRENFAQLKELLITSGLEYKILNETYSKEILIKVNIN